MLFYIQRVREWKPDRRGGGQGGFTRQNKKTEKKNPRAAAFGGNYEDKFREGSYFLLFLDNDV